MIEQYIYQYPLYGLMKVWNFAVQNNFRLQQIVNLAHPRLSILVAALLEEEAFYKKIGLNLYSQNSMTTNLKIFDVPDKNDMKEKLTFSEFLVYLRSMDKSPEKIKKMIINDSEIEKELLELVQKCEKQIFLNFKLEEKDIVFDLFEEQDNSEEKHEEIKMEQNETLKNREENLLGEDKRLKMMNQIHTLTILKLKIALR